MIKRRHFKSREQDERRLKLLSEVHGLNITSVIRIAIFTLARQTGLEKELPSDLIKNNNT